MNLEQQFHLFLKKYSLQRPLLGLSGGPDSMALFHLLIGEGISFEVAHIDHRWRGESQEQASQLEALCQKFCVVFHLKILDINGPNIEDRCRNERLAFFASLSSKVILGHHADDQAETVLKRVFEGARLTKLKGLSCCSKMGEMELFRPLLAVSKAEILDWLNKKEIAYFEDETNRDAKYLRSRMREEILPTLSKMFGKKVEPSLCRLGKLAAELDEFTQKLIERYPFEGLLDLSQDPPQSTFEWRIIVSNFFEKKGITPSSLQLDQMIEHLQKKSCHKHLRIKNRYVKLHRQTIEIID